MRNLKTLFCLLFIVVVFITCSKKAVDSQNKPLTDADFGETLQTSNGITFKVFNLKSDMPFKGIVVMGSGNDENNPSPGSLDESTEIDFCRKAAANGYLAADVQYRQTPGIKDWNATAKIVGDDYNTCITYLAAKYNVDKAKSVVGGYSYASFALLTASADYNSVPYAKGILVACGAAISDEPTKLNNPIFSIACSGNNESGYPSGQALYDLIPDSSPIKANSAGITDTSCSTHCGGDWTEILYEQLTKWVP